MKISAKIIHFLETIKNYDFFFIIKYMNAHNISNNLSIIISHMEIPLQLNLPKDLISKNISAKNIDVGNIRRDIINTRNINIITIPKLVKSLDIIAAEKIKRFLYDKYDENTVIQNYYCTADANSRNIRNLILITEMPIIEFINYLINPNTPDARIKKEIKNQNIILKEKLLYRSKKLLYKIIEKKK